MMFRNIYETSYSMETAKERLNQWFAKIEKHAFPSFITAANLIITHQDTILAYFNNRSTNALAEILILKSKPFEVYSEELVMWDFLSTGYH